MFLGPAPRRHDLREHGCSQQAEELATRAYGVASYWFAGKRCRPWFKGAGHVLHSLIVEDGNRGIKIAAAQDWSGIAWGGSSLLTWDATKAGNPHMRVSLDGAGFTMSVALSHLAGAKQEGEDHTTHSAPRITGGLWVPEKYRGLLVQWLSSPEAYSVELIRSGDLFRAHITGPSGMEPAKPNLSKGVLAFDINPDGLAFHNLDAKGNTERFRDGFVLTRTANTTKYEGECHIGIGNGVIWIKVPDLANGSTSRRDYLAGVVAKLACEVATQLAKPLAFEALGFAKGHDTNGSFNRMSTGFAYEKVLDVVVRRAVKAQVGWVAANPAFTSVIGRWKYQAAEGLSVHQAAAKVIGRCALGHRERFDPSTRNRIGELRVGLINTAQVAKAQNVPTEETRSLTCGIAKRLTRPLADERLVVANGHPPWRLMWRKRSPWGALVECQRYRSSRAVAAGATTMPVGDLTDRQRTDEVTR